MTTDATPAPGAFETFRAILARMGDEPIIPESPDPAMIVNAAILPAVIVVTALLLARLVLLAFPPPPARGGRDPAPTLDARLPWLVAAAVTGSVVWADMAVRGTGSWLIGIRTGWVDPFRAVLWSDDVSSRLLPIVLVAGLIAVVRSLLPVRRVAGVVATSIAGGLTGLWATWATLGPLVATDQMSIGAMLADAAIIGGLGLVLPPLLEAIAGRLRGPAFPIALLPMGASALVLYHAGLATLQPMWLGGLAGGLVAVGLVMWRFGLTGLWAIPGAAMAHWALLNARYSWHDHASLLPGVMLMLAPLGAALALVPLPAVPRRGVGGAVARAGQGHAGVSAMIGAALVVSLFLAARAAVEGERASVAAPVVADADA